MSAGINRRQYLQAIATATAAIGIPAWSCAAEKSDTPKIGFSLYGMKALPLNDALRECAEIGYECVELVAMPDWSCAPERLNADHRRDVRQQLSDRGLELASIMENLTLAAEGDAHRNNLDRLKRAAQLSRDIAPDSPPIIETILGGSPDKWPMLREHFIERLRDWAKVAEESQAVIAIKAHVAGALHLPKDTADLVRTINSRWLQATYDFSHFQLRGLGMKESWDTLSDQTRFVHVKDARGEPGKFQFLLPGAGSTDYTELFRLLKASRYAGAVVVEVSAQLHSKPDYDPIAAAKSSWPILRDARAAAK